MADLLDMQAARRRRIAAGKMPQTVPCLRSMPSPDDDWMYVAVDMGMLQGLPCDQQAAGSLPFRPANSITLTPVTRTP